MECLRDSFSNDVVLGGRYKTLSPLNHGSFGMVFTAADLKTDQVVAVKCLTKKAAATDAGFDFAIDEKSEELLLHRRLGNYANIVNLIDSFETEAHVYLVLEFCPRGDLYEAIRADQGPLETEHVRRFMLELVDAVAYMHSKGVYHRDIKPENIFLTQSGSVKLGDFGLATTDRWTFESAVGSDRYMSPEQYDSAGAGYSPAQADVWAVGICLLNILFSRNPFTTPTESDPLFLDFSRDKQSLFDVFPSMSQDTYEIIVQCMNLDPSKRSLARARSALCRAVSFTTSDEALDEFCSADRCVVASLNREPLRTPSIQTPQADNGAFPWAKALLASPLKSTRQLSIIPDNESYTEDLFSKSGRTSDCMSGTLETPSIGSMFGSSLGASILPSQPAASGSLPINMSRPRLQPSMSMIFGRKDAVSKSWSDMWDEDIEEEELEHERQLQELKAKNSRTWSNESSKPGDDEDTPRMGLSPAFKSMTLSIPRMSSLDSALATKDIDEDLGADGFFFHEAVEEGQPESGQARYAPPSKRSNADKWAALGEARRRAHTGDSSGDEGSPKATQFGRFFDFGGIGPGVSDPFGLKNSPQRLLSLRHPLSTVCTNMTTCGTTCVSPSGTNPTPAGVISHQGRQDRQGLGGLHTPCKDRPKECPRSKGRDRDWNWNFDWRKAKRHGFGGIEWVGGWQTARS